MRDYQLTDLQAMLIRHEGLKLFPYLDTVGKWTIGSGRNLTDKGISEDEAVMFLNRDIADAIHDAMSVCSIYDELTKPRQMVLVSMAFTLGKTRLMEFVRFLNALHLNDYDEAADQLLQSAWHKQAPARVEELAGMMRDSKSVRI